MTRKTLTAAARQRLDAIVERYKPESLSLGVATSITGASGLELAAVSLCRDELERARSAFDSNRWQESLRLYADVGAISAQIATTGSNNGDAKAVATSALLGQVANLLNLQDVGRARELLGSLDDASLDTRQRTVLARALVELNDAKRARSVLDAVPESERANERWREASTLVDIAGGTIPSEFNRDPSVLYSLARHCLISGEVKKAATFAFEGLGKGPQNSILLSSLVSTAMVALLRTVYEDDLMDGGIAVDARAESANKIAQQFKLVFSAELPSPVRANLLEVALNYSSSLRERELFNWIFLHSEQSERERGHPNEVRLAFESAEKGDLSRALELLPKQDHPWRSDLTRARLVHVAGDRAAAIEILRGLAATWPGRVPIHLSLADALIDGRDFAAALPHAEISYRGFPTPSIAILLARCLLESHQGSRCLQVLGNLETTEQILELRAYAADEANDPRAPEFWALLLTYDAQDVNAKLRLAAALVRAGDIEGAARHARDLLENSVSALGRDQIAACGQMLSMARFLPKSDPLIQRAAEELHSRFGSDDEAEMLRLTLLSSLGFPATAVPIDYERLARAGQIKAVSLDDAAATIRDRATLVNAAHTMYREGWLDAESMCQVTGIKLARLVVGWSKVAATGRTPLRAAIVPGVSTADEPVRDRIFLCSTLELLLLHKCGALEHVPLALGEGFLTALESTWAQLVEDCYYLEQSAQRDELARVTRLLAVIAAAPGLRRVEKTERPRDVAARDGLAFVTAEPTDESDFDARCVLHSLMASGAISRPRFEQAITCFGGDPELPLRVVDLGGRWFFENGLLELFDSAGLLDVLLSAAPDITVTDAAIEGIRCRFEELEAQGEAAALQRDVVELLGAGIRAGWFRLTKAPALSMFPELRPEVDRARAALLTRSIRQQAVLKELLAENETWQRIAADSFGFDSLGHPSQWRVLAFRDERQGQDFIRKYLSGDKHEITLSRFVRSVVLPSGRGSVMRMLAQLGFADALLPDDLVSLVSEYGRADTGGCARILDGMESSVGDPFSRGVFARSQIALVYAMTLWKLAVSGTDWKSRPVARQLLSRLDMLDTAHSSRLVEQTVCNLVLLALDQREASFVGDSSGIFSLLPSSIAGRLWLELASWRANEQRREAGFRRALTQAWQQLDQLKGGPRTTAQWAPLSLAVDVLLTHSAFSDAVPSPDAVVAVLSSLWEERPLARRTMVFGDSGAPDRDVETLLLSAAAVVANQGSPAWRSDDGTSLTFSYSPLGSQHLVDVSVPVEAVILRMDPDSAARIVKGFAVGNGARDGRLYRALTEFAKAPTDNARRTYLARAACSAPFRLVADDPRFVFSFGDRYLMTQLGYPATLEELREVLSESNDLMGADLKTLGKRFAARFDADGLWGDRDDQYGLLMQASSVPGPLPAAAARSTFDQREHRAWNETWHELLLSQNVPIGTLASASAFAMLALCRDPKPEHAAAVIDAFVAMLKREFAAKSEPDTLASVEPDALNLIGRVVSRLAPWGIPVEEHAWLTTRLYEWWIREVDVAEACGFLARDVEPTWQRLRAEVVLNVMLDVLEGAVVTTQRVPELPSLLIEALRELACREGTNPFEAARRPAWIYWDRPQGCEWLASSILLWGEPNAFFDLRPELRLAILEKLPHTNEQTSQHGISFQPVFRALSRGAAKLTEPEIGAVRQWLDTAGSGGLLDLWRADLLTGLFAARGDLEAAAAPRKLALRESLRPALAEIVGGYLEAASSPKVSGVEMTVVELLDAVSRADDGEERVEVGIALALSRPNQARVVEMLRCVLRLETLSLALRSTIDAALASDVDMPPP